MACNCGRKSAAQKYNFTDQALTTTPAPLSMGSTAGLPTGPSIVDRGNNLGVKHSGLYRLSAQLIVAVSAAGTLNVQAYYDGKPVASSRKTLPVAVGSQQITLDDLMYLPVPDACGCAGVTVPVDIYAWTADSGAANVSSLSVNLLREA